MRAKTKRSKEFTGLIESPYGVMIQMGRIGSSLRIGINSEKKKLPEASTQRQTKTKMKRRA